MARPDFPRTIIEFQHRFPDEDACRQYLFESRWPEGFRCPRCGSEAATGLPRRLLWQCSACRYQVSVTAGTVLRSDQALSNVCRTASAGWAPEMPYRPSMTKKGTPLMPYARACASSARTCSQ